MSTRHKAMQDQNASAEGTLKRPWPTGWQQLGSGKARHCAASSQLGGLKGARRCSRPWPIGRLPSQAQALPFAGGAVWSSTCMKQINRLSSTATSMLAGQPFRQGCIPLLQRAVLPSCIPYPQELVQNLPFLLMSNWVVFAHSFCHVALAPSGYVGSTVT